MVSVLASQRCSGPAAGPFIWVAAWSWYAAEHFVMVWHKGIISDSGFPCKQNVIANQS